MRGHVVEIRNTSKAGLDGWAALELHSAVSLDGTSLECLNTSGDLDKLDRPTFLKAMSGSYGGAYHATTRDPDRNVNIGNPRLRAVDRLINTTNSYRRQMNVQILMKYEAVQGILHQFPLETLAARFDTNVLPPESPDLPMSALKHLNLCPRDTVSLRRYHSESLWRIWGRFLRGLSGVLSCNESALSTDGGSPHHQGPASKLVVHRRWVPIIIVHD